MRGSHVLVAFSAMLAFAGALPLREQMPRITGENLSGHKVSLPYAAAGSVAIICIGFSHASQSQVKAWAESATNAFHQNGGVLVYSVAVLEDAPRIVRGMAVRAMKSGVPAQQRDRFVVVYEGESELKKITEFHRPEEAYILLLDPTGEVERVSHGPVSDAALQALAALARSLQPSK